MHEFCCDFDTVKFINKRSFESSAATAQNAHSSSKKQSAIMAKRERPMRWILLVLNEPGELAQIIDEIISNRDVLALYGPESYFKTSPEELI